MRQAGAEEVAAVILGTMRAGRPVTGLEDLRPDVLRGALDVLVDYDPDLVVRIAVEAVDRAAQARQEEASVRELPQRGADTPG